jgi:glucosamine kinase
MSKLHNAPTFFLGIDGGGSRTRAAIIEASGRVVGLGEAGPSNIHQVGATIAQENIHSAVQNALRAGGLHTGQPFAAAFFGMAGVATEAERKVIREIAHALKLAPKNKIGVDHDIHIAHAGALAGREGLVLIAGTGSACYGRHRSGRDARAGGFGPILDDGGGGFWLGLQAMKAVLRAEDGRAPKTSLRGILFKALNIKLPRELIVLAADPTARLKIAALAPTIARASQAGDKVARAIVARGAGEIALMAHTVSRKLKLPPRVAVALVGGLSTDPIYTRAIHCELKQRLPNCEIVKTGNPPVIGAALLARRSIE